jgi:hypothetical protein
MVRRYVPEAGDIAWIDFDPQCACFDIKIYHAAASGKPLDFAHDQFLP